MANAACTAFSQDGQYFAYCGSDGKLKIWETATSRLKQEYVPNLHLYSPCSVLCWISVNTQATSTSVCHVVFIFLFNYVNKNVYFDLPFVLYN